MFYIRKFNQKERELACEKSVPFFFFGQWVELHIYYKIVEINNATAT